MEKFLKLLKTNAGLVLAILCLVIYITWFIWFQPTVTPTDGFEDAKPAVSHAKVSGALLTVPIKVVPKKNVKDKFPEAQIKEDEEWTDTSEIPPLENGGVMLTKIDTVTGETTNQLQANKAPWFAFEGKNAIGVGIDTTQQGKIYYKRDFIRIKDVHLQGEVQVRGGADKAEAFAGANLEFRF